MRVFVAGGTGLIGRHLAARLRSRGDSVVVLTRNAASARGVLPDAVSLVEGDPTIPGRWQDQLSGSDAVVNLAGEPLFARRWSRAQKERIRSSRVAATRSIVEALATCARPPGTLVNGSAIGYYGPRGDEPLSEDACAGSGFLSELCVDWEVTAEQASGLGVRVVLLRTGVVLACEGGALPQMMKPR